MGGSAPEAKKFPSLTTQQERLLRSLIEDYVLPSFEEGGIKAYEGQLTPGRNAILRNVYDDVRDEHGRLNETPEMGLRNDRIRSLMGGSPVFDMDPDTRRKFYESQVSDPSRAKSRDVGKAIAKRYGSGSEGDLRGGAAVSGAALDETLSGKSEELVYRDVGRERLSRERARGRQYAGARLDTESRTSDLANAMIVGHAERTEEGQQLGEDFYKWQTEQPYYNPWLGYLPQVLGTQTFTTGTFPGTPSLAGPILAGALQGVTGGFLAGQQLFGNQGFQQTQTTLPAVGNTNFQNYA